MPGVLAFQSDPCDVTYLSTFGHSVCKCLFLLAGQRRVNQEFRKCDSPLRPMSRPFLEECRKVTIVFLSGHAVVQR